MPGQDTLPRLAVIGGTGVPSLPFETPPAETRIPTAWGDARVQTGILQGREVVFLRRHGAGHAIPPHRINYRANLAALAALGVRGVLATAAVGSLRADWMPGTLVLPDNLIDFALARGGKTFFDGQPGAPVVHADVTAPYSETLRAALKVSAASLGLALIDGGTYLCADGPRYETSAEVRLFAAWGADMVGMTGVPEATLAREAGLHYAAVAAVTNLGAGIATTPFDHGMVGAAMERAGPRLAALLLDTLGRTDPAALPATGPGAALPESPAP